MGFRPFVWLLARKHSLSGFVRNDAEGVDIEVEGTEESISAFIVDVARHPPPLTVIDKLEVGFQPPHGCRSFTIEDSRGGNGRFTLISPDITLCHDCLRELSDPSDFRFGYPFINCTNCGPRFTIISDVPYDRERTTMREFSMCPTCQREYDDPSSRRYHAQPNSCPACGPTLELVGAADSQEPLSSPLERARELLRAGRIVAIKGIGGFHLACDAENDDAVSLLRRRKHREEKPFAAMCPDIETASLLCEISDEERELLASAKRPVVLLKKRHGCPLSEHVAPGSPSIGVMLPYTPLHHLLFRPDGPSVAEGRGGRTPTLVFKALVMTSGNVSDEPIAYRNADALSRLANIADSFLLHDRDIHVRCDDSVARVFKGTEMVLRRSRSYVPDPIRLPFTTGDVLACGAELKNTFCLTHEGYAFMSHHVGDLENLETLEAFEEGIEHFKRLFRLSPAIIAHDLHPEYLSTKYAMKLAGENPTLKLIGVQHHHAHVASAMAENGYLDTVIGVAFDGAGLGVDGTLWGGEFLIADYHGAKRVAHLASLPLAGGEMAIRQPWRMAFSYLRSAYGNQIDRWPLDDKRCVQEWIERAGRERVGILARMVEREVNSPATTSAGRLFDAVASLIGVRDAVNFEGQAAIQLENLAAEICDSSRYRYEIRDVNGLTTIYSAPLIRDIVGDLDAGVEKSRVARRFHNTVSDMIVQVCRRLRQEIGLSTVALSGGVFQNMLLLESASRELAESGFQVLTHGKVPPNDGGISLGQAIVADRIWHGSKQ